MIQRPSGRPKPPWPYAWTARLCAAAALAAALEPSTAAAAAAAANPAPPATITPQALRAWLTQNIVSQGWTLVDASQQEALFTQPRTGSRVGTNLRVAARWEAFFYPTPAHPWRSALQTLDLDCQARRFKEVKWAAYSGSNFMGSVVENDATGDDWRTLVAGSLMASLAEAQCPPPA